MKSLYYAKTAYHLILCSCIEHKHKHDRSLLLMSPGFEGWKNVLDTLKNTCSPFNKTKLLRPDVGVPPTIKRHYDKGLNAWQSVGIVRKFNPNRIWTCKDGSPVSNTILANSRKSCECIYVEDGGSTYAIKKHSLYSGWKKIVKKLIYGPWFSKVKVRGTSSEISGIAAVYPNNIKPELKSLKKYRIKPDYLKKYGKRWAKKLLKKQNTDLKTVSDIDVLILMSKISGTNTDKRKYIKVVRKILKESLDKGYTVGVKYHPAEEEDEYLTVNDEPNVVSMPTAIPAELLLCSIENINRVVGYTTTALITTKWLFDDVRSISMSNSVGSDFPRLTKVMEDVGVEVI